MRIVAATLILCAGLWNGFAGVVDMSVGIAGITAQNTSISEVSDPQAEAQEIEAVPARMPIDLGLLGLLGVIIGAFLCVLSLLDLVCAVLLLRQRAALVVKLVGVLTVIGGLGRLFFALETNAFAASVGESVVFGPAAFACAALGIVSGVLVVLAVKAGGEPPVAQSPQSQSGHP